jgi:hypothetical protein
MMDDSFIREVRQGAIPPSVLNVDGVSRLVMPPGWVEHKKVHPAVEPLKVGTLAGLVDYVKMAGGATSDDTGPLVIHVESPSCVKVRSKLEDEATDFRRLCYCVASLDMVGTPPGAGIWMDAETFMVTLLTGFVASDDRAELALLLGSIRESSVRDVVDDTVSQEVKTGRGIHLVGATAVKNPWLLAPYRTFREIDQPVSPFLLRLASGKENESKPKCALFECDGGVWKLNAIEHIKEFLATALEGTAVPVIG